MINELCLRCETTTSSLIERNSLLITAQADVQSIDGSIKHDSFATPHRVASTQTRVLYRRDMCVVLAAFSQAETSNGLAILSRRLYGPITLINTDTP